MKKKIAISSALLLAYYAVVTYLSGQSDFPELIHDWQRFDKLIHFIEYVPIGFLLVRVLIYTPAHSLRRAFAVGFVVGLGLALLDEWHQSRVPHRDANIWDVVADVLGVVVGMGIYVRIAPLLRHLRDQGKEARC